MYLWWAVARVTARTREELEEVGPHPRRLNAGAQNVPAAMLAGYRGMVTHSSPRSAFWREVWTVALHLLECGTLPGDAPSASYPRLLTPPQQTLTTWSTGPSRVFGSEFSSDVAGDGPGRGGANWVGFTSGGLLGISAHSTTRPVSWRTGPASLAGSAFSSDVEGDGPKSRAAPIAPKERGLRSAGRLASAAVVCQRFWRRRRRVPSASG